MWLTINKIEIGKPKDDSGVGGGGVVKWMMCARMIMHALENEEQMWESNNKQAILISFGLQFVHELFKIFLKVWYGGRFLEWLTSLPLLPSAWLSQAGFFHD